MRINREDVLRYITDYYQLEKYIRPYIVDKGFYYHSFWVFIWVSTEIHEFFQEWLNERFFYRVQSNLKGSVWTGTTAHFGDSAWVEQNKSIRGWGEKHGYQFFNEN
jgi:hypothetical protein